MTVREFMAKSGVPMHLKGYEKLKLTLEMNIENPEWNLGKIYSEISKQYGCSYESIRKNVFDAIKKGYPEMDDTIKKIVFSGKEDSPRVGEYIKSVSYAIRNNLI